MEFTSEELREGTKRVIQSYMYGENMVKLENEEYPWSDTTYHPPDVDGEDNR
ncbi:hypothetical protein [Oceanobacillus sp. 1P07AA]|uniref:hypothetical protein n=1 Tax=Oceanobacillus sp. 1P07AA TaxID=3132293 RepID=UPI0039A70F70